jgi:hypothetical protein
MPGCCCPLLKKYYWQGHFVVAYNLFFGNDTSFSLVRNKHEGRPTINIANNIKKSRSKISDIFLIWQELFPPHLLPPEKLAKVILLMKVQDHLHFLIQAAFSIMKAFAYCSPNLLDFKK